MKFSINQSELQNALSVVLKGVATRSTLPILSGVFLEADNDSLTLQTTDLELSVQYTVAALVEQPGRAVQVLNEQVEDLTGGTVSRGMMNAALSIGVACSVGMAMLRVLTGISIYYILVPGYLAALGLTFCVPKIFTGIAFDSGGVASGPMTTTFLLPFAMGACEALGGNVMTDAFGIVAMVAMTPLLTIQVLGLIYKKKQNSEDASDVSTEDEDSIIVLEGAEHE